MRSIKKTQKKGGVLTLPSQKEIDNLVRSYRNIYVIEKKLRKGRIQSREIKSWARTLREAESILIQIEPFLRRGKKINEETGRRFGFNIALRLLREGSSFLSDLPRGGRPADLTLGLCATSLGNLFKERTRNPHWEKVGTNLEKWFPDALPPDDSGRDVRLWAYNLAKRYRRIRPEGVEKPYIGDLIQSNSTRKKR